MLFKMTEVKYQPNPVLERALDVLFILHADHEQNCSTSAMRTIGSSQVDPVLGAGRRGGGALRPAARRRQRGGAADAQRDRLGVEGAGVHQAGEVGRGAQPADGIRPPRLQVVRPAGARSSSRSPTWCSTSPARTRCSTSRSSSSASRCRTTTSSRASSIPNVDFYSGLIYQAMGFPVEMFPVLFAIPRTAGWIAQWEEMLLDPEQKIARPRQIYTGPAARDYVARGQAELSDGRPGRHAVQRGACSSSCGQRAARRLGRARKCGRPASRSTGRPRFSSQKMTFERPDIGPTSISCSRPTRLAGTAA